MKKNYGVIAKAVLTFFAFSLLMACEDEISSTGAGIVDQVNFETNLADNFSVLSYSVNYPEGVQTNGLPEGVLGVYDDPIYGRTTASYLTQVALSRFDPEFGEEPVVDSVILRMPYFSSVLETDEDGVNDYALDSVFANNGSVKLSIYRSSFFLNDLDPDTGFETPQVYNSNDISSPSGRINESLLMGELLGVVLDEDGLPEADEADKLDAFRPDDREIILLAQDINDDGTIDTDSDFSVSERLSPSLRVRLDNDYWQEAILDQEGSTNLLNDNSFNDYFRGLYFKIESLDPAFGHYTIFDLDESNITIYYSFTGDDDSSEPGEPTNDGRGEIGINFAGINVLDLDNDFDQGIIQSIETSDQVNGEANLYLKGGNGSLAIIDLFGPRFDLGDGEEFQSELEILRDCGVIVNEANLILYVDQEDAIAGLGELEPERLFVYDFDNRRTLLDGAIDNTVGLEGPVDSRVNHLGRLTREEEDVTSNGVSYRIRLTQHLNNVITNDSTNVRLGVAVSQNVLIDNTALIVGSGDLENGDRVPVSSVISPEGTIIHGNLSPDDLKRLRLRINYTLTEDIDPNSPCGQLLGLE